MSDEKGDREKAPPQEEELGFTAAMTELEEILRRIESDDTDLDELGRELQRAAQLLEACRGAIRRVEAEVGDVLEKLTDDGG